ncbi:MAG: response regulator [candidate division Zixibacteria bacterium]|nr:response regulator [candidate division Zixibacteria bacterium]
MNILLLEDQGSVSVPLQNLLESRDHTIYNAPNLSRAKYFLKKYPIDCHIVDLNLPPEGLEPEKIKLTKDGLYSGWIFILEYISKIDIAQKKRTIIYTEYMNKLRAYVPKKELDGIYLLEKGSIGPTKKILEALSKIEKSLPGKAK